MEERRRLKNGSSAMKILVYEQVFTDTRKGAVLIDIHGVAELK